MTDALEAADETDKPAYQFVIKFAGIECGLFKRLYASAHKLAV